MKDECHSLISNLISSLYAFIFVIVQFTIFNCLVLLQKGIVIVCTAQIIFSGLQNQIVTFVNNLN